MICVFCREEVAEPDMVHEADALNGDGKIYACDPCVASYEPPPPEPMGCEECFAAFGKGCRCDENRLAIGRGEAAKAAKEEQTC